MQVEAAPSMKHQAIIFDLDGTLLDTLADLSDSANHVLAARGLPTHSLRRYCDFIGEGLGMLIRQMLPEGQRDEQTMAEVTEAYRAQYARRWNAKTKPYDGVPEMLDSLRDRRVKTAVLSNKPDQYTQKCVAGLLPRWRFDPVMGQRDDVPRKPDPAGALQIAAAWDLAPSEIVYAGDTQTDVQTAVAAGMQPVGVLWGFRPDELRAGNDAILIERPEQVLDVLDGTYTM